MPSSVKEGGIKEELLTEFKPELREFGAALIRAAAGGCRRGFDSLFQRSGPGAFEAVA